MDGQFLRRAGLADTGLAGEHDDAPMPGAGLLKGTAQYLELVLPPDKFVSRCRGKGFGGAAVGNYVGRPGWRSRGVSGYRDAVDMHRPRDVLDPLLAAVLEGKVEPVADLIAHHAADAHFARLGESFEARGDIDAVAVDIALVENHVAEVDADAKLDAPFHRHVGVALCHCLLDLDGATHRIDDARKLDEQPVAGGLDDAAPVLLDLRIPQLAPDRLQPGERAFLVGTHQPRIAGNVGG